MTHKIMQDGIELIRGDALSIGVIFGNLSGLNKDHRSQPWRLQTHEEYMAYMAHELGVRIEPEKLVMTEV
jgi:hypothetical protein